MPRRPLIVTASGKRSRRSETEDAEVIARTLGVPFVPYERGVPVMALLETAEAALVMRGDGLYLVDTHGECRFSAGMAEIRLRRLDDAIPQADHVLSAGELNAGDHVLDCTLGLAQDARVIARVVGSGGRVVGVERSFPLFAFVSTGLAIEEPWPGSCRIECVHASAEEFLTKQPSASFDCVYFDPMFSKPSSAQPAFELLRRHAEHAPLTNAVIEEARRVAKRWVVVKAPPQGGDLHRLGLTALPFRKSADLRFARVPAIS